ncbi:translocation/assembly module TamB domain-containing protein [Capnocytophaga sp.]|uniref:translocation/assembly module TamB domain-containing protein n=1 Tax=Capnocytophaga sp. TaxID=44737 RepID=UPI0026DB7BC4|nr:translocation/assembly module TamB [Capnocytophaga sp.]MDO5105137.1 translocation/assembly module TamB domain-containing protein [Capnocytophaga sp.]
MLLGVIAILLALPVTQTFIAKKAMNWLNSDYDVNIQIEKVHLKINGDVALKRVLIKDFQQDTLISAKEIETSVLKFGQLLEGNLYFGTIDADSLIFNMKTYKGDTLSNLDVFISKFDSGEPSTGTFIMKSKAINLKNSSCYISDFNSKNPSLLQIENLNVRLNDFNIIDSEVFFEAQNGKLTYDKKIDVTHLDTKFAYTDSLLSVDNLNFKTKDSDLEGNIRFYLDSIGFGDFSNHVTLDVKIAKANLATNDLNVFYDGFTKGKTLSVNNLLIKGILNDFETSEGEITYQNTILEGTFTFKNLLSDDKKLIISGKDIYLETIYNDLATLLPVQLGQNLPAELQRLEMFSLHGDLLYTTTALQTNLELRSYKGNATLDGVLENLENVENMFYKGRLSTQNLDVGALIDDQSVGALTAQLEVEGRGYDLKTIKLHASGNVNSFSYNDYNYNNISVNGEFKNQVFNGKVTADDTNLKMNFSGLADFSKNNSKFDFQANIDIADLHALKFVQSDSISKFKGNIVFNIQGNDLDAIVGEIRFKNTQYTNSTDVFLFDDFEVTSSLSNDGIKEITINSPDIISGNVKGKFKMIEAKKVLQNAFGSIYAHYKPYKIAQNQYIEFSFNIYNKIIEVFVPKVKIGKNTILKGKIVADDGSFKMQFKSPEINAYDYQIDGIDLKIDNKNPLYNAFFEVGKADLGAYSISDFNLINATIKDTLFFRTEFKGGDTQKDFYELNFYHTLNKKQESIIGLKRSLFNFKENAWFINRENSDKQNKIIINRTADSIKIDNFRMAHHNQHINLSGLITKDDYKNLHIVANNVSLAKITPEMKGLDLRGTLNGHLSLTQKGNLYYPSSDLFIRYFRLNGYDYGDLEASVFGNSDLSSFSVSARFVNGKTLGFRTDGKIHLDKKRGTLLDLNARFQDFNLAPFNPFVEGLLFDLRGWVSGNIAIQGSIENPAMDGELSIRKGGVGITYLNLNADIEEDAKLKVNHQTFELPNWTLTDTAFKTQAILNGNIRHNKLSDWFFDLNLKSKDKRFLVLNTEYAEGALFYGTGFIQGEASIKGAIDELVISVKAKTEDGTQFKIPLSEGEGIGDDSFITFVEKGNQEIKVERTLESVKGLELKFELDVLPSAEIEIVMDRKTGSNLVGRGDGTLLIEINTNGKFNMWGDFITYSGYYNFKFENIIDKRFTVLPGGSISWSGDPLKATLRDLKAAYTLNANPSVLLESSQYNRKIPTQVLIKLEGELMQPETLFDVTFPDSNPSLVSELNYRMADQDRKQLQAFSLLAQGSFMSDKNTDNRLVAYNLFETAAGLFNNLLSDEDNKLNLGVSYEAGVVDSSSEIASSDRLGFTVSTQITEWASVNAKVGIPVGGVTRTAVAGNVEVQFRLTETGSLSAKLFFRENEWQQYQLDRIGYTQGAGITYSVDFNTFKELINKIFAKGGKIIEPINKEY